MDKELMKPVAWMCDYIEDGEHEREYNGHNEFSCGRTGVPLYRLPPMPRDVLMAALGACRAECAKHYLGDADESEINLAAIADRYASKAQPEQPDPLDAVGEVMELRAWRAVLRGLCVGRELLTPDECAENVRHQLRTAKKAAANQPEPVNQQLLAALNHAADALERAEFFEQATAARAAIDDASASQPLWQDGYAQGVEAVAKMLEKKADDYASQYGHDDMGSLSFGGSQKGELMRDYHSGLLELADDVRAMLAAVEQPVGEWKHCSPELLASGIDCGTAPRRACQCPHGGSHDHFVVKQPAIAAAEAAQPVCQTCKGSGYIGDFLTLAHDCPDCQQPASAQPVAVPDGKQNIGTKPVKDGYFLCKCDECGWIGSSEETESGADGETYYCPSCRYESPNELISAAQTFNAMLSAAPKTEGV